VKRNDKILTLEVY